MKRLLVSAATALALTTLSAPTLAKDKPVLLKVPVTFGTHLPGLGTTIKWVGDRIKTASGGSVKMKIYEPKKLVAPFEILDAVSSGKVNAGYATAGYWAGKIPASPLFSAVPFGPEAGEYLAWVYYGNGRKLYQEMYDQAGYNVHVVPCGIIAPETSGWFAKPINSADDLKGMSMRFFGLGGQVMQKLGVSTTLLPGGEIFPALEKKAIDASEFSMPAIDQRLGFHKIVKYNYFPGWHQQATMFELLINKDVWNKMSESQQMVTEVMCKAAMTEGFAQGEAIQFDVMKENAEKRGVKIMYWSDDMLSLFRSKWQEVVEENKKDAFFNKVWSDLSKFRGGYDLWEAYAFLPRAQRPKK
ncbi:MAG: TRAP transporter substrate-binding protein [Gammaproteobacteria bacterium]|nr:TRAP transporter substrate-binding protein [Gammaproteobacteria bacterium]